MIVMVTGASGGIGKAAAELLAKRGHTVYGTYRSNEPQAKSWEALYMDVNDEESVKAAIEAVIKKEGRLDAVLNNAGMGVAGPLELTAEDEARAQLDVNFLGAVTVARCALPYLRESHGRLVCTSSLAAAVPIPFQSLYSASKAALELTFRALNLECRAFQVRCVCVELGDTKTGFTKSRRYVRAAKGDRIYGEVFQRSVGKMEHDEQTGHDPADIAKTLIRAAERKNPPPVMVCGGFEKLVYVLSRLLPVRLFDRIIAKLYA